MRLRTLLLAAIVSCGLAGLAEATPKTPKPPKHPAVRVNNKAAARARKAAQKQAKSHKAPRPMKHPKVRAAVHKPVKR